MNKEKIEQNIERVWTFLFHTLGCSEKEALEIIGKINRSIKIKLAIGKIEKMSNNCFVDERCIICEEMFDASRKYIYRVQNEGYLCYECGNKLIKIKK